MHTGQLQEIVLLLLASVFIVAFFKRLHLSPVLGYLVAGGLIGPHGLGLVKDVETTHYIAEFGVVFLLFMIGIELTFERLKSMRGQVFGYGSAQIVLTAAAIASFCHYVANLSLEASFIIGGCLSLSSTAIVLQVIKDRNKQFSQTGRLSLATLIMQDLMVVPLLIMVPLLGQENTDLFRALGLSLAQAMAALLVIFIVGKQFLRPFFAVIAALKSEELFVATTLLVVLGTAWATGELGLSLALGAFVAGLLVAETEYSHQVEADIKPFKGLLMGLFFITIGMRIDLFFFADRYLEIILLTLGLIVTKAVIIFFLSRLTRFKLETSIKTALILSQGSEFAFVLFALATDHHLLPPDLTQLLLIIVSCSMALTPLLAAIGDHLPKALERPNAVEYQSSDVECETRDLFDHIIVAGYGRVGKTTCKLLGKKRLKYVAIDEDPSHVHEGRREGIPVYYGDASRTDILESLGVSRAKLVAVTIDNHKSSLKVTRGVRQHHPDIIIIARARDRVHADELRAAGATIALAEMFESSLLLGGAILKETGEHENEIVRIVEQFRAEEYPVKEYKEFFHHAPEAEKG